MTKLQGLRRPGHAAVHRPERAAPGLSKATGEPAAVRRAGDPRPPDASATPAQTAGPKLAAVRRPLADLAAHRAAARSPVGNNLSALLDTFEKTRASRT